MVIKQRMEPAELVLLRFLKARLDLPENLNTQLLNGEKGFEGEVKLDNLLDELSIDCFVLKDLLLEHNNTTFQIDTLIIVHHFIYLLEVKNYEGDYFIEKDQWYTRLGTEIKNPLHQMKRSETLLRQLLQPLSLNLSIESHLIFTHSEFSLFQASKDLPIILPTQLNRFFKKLNKNPSKLNQIHKKLADFLINKHQTENPYVRLPEYKYEELRKGIICKECGSLLTASGRDKLVCNYCNNEEDLDSGVMRSVKEFQLLFPERKLTVGTISEWCELIDSPKKIRRILKKNLDLKRLGRFSHYV